MIVGADGNPTADEQRCQRCGSRPKDHEIHKAFGGWWRRLCRKCGTELESGREES